MLGKPFIYFTLFCIACVVLGLYFFRLATTNTISTDAASNVLYAADIAHGNWLLRGWTLPEDPYWFTNVMVYVAGVAVHGMTPGLVYVVPVMACVALLFVLAAAATIGFRLGRPLRHSPSAGADGWGCRVTGYRAERGCSGR